MTKGNLMGKIFGIAVVCLLIGSVFCDVVWADGSLSSITIRVKRSTYGSGDIVTLDLETEYLPVVVVCENGDAPYESMKAQAIAARTFAMYKKNHPYSDFDVYDDTRDQVYNPAVTVTNQHRQSVADTNGIVLEYTGDYHTIICAFYVSGTGSKAQYVTYNEGKSGDDITQTTLGYRTNPPSKFPDNRGCMGQVLANNLASSNGYNYQQILRYFYGSDIEGLGSYVTPMVAAGGSHTVGLKSDGTMVAVGDNYNGQCNVGGWTDIIYVDAGGTHTVGLKDNGTVVAVGDNASGQCNVGGWTGITQVAAGSYHTVGLRFDGTVVAVGDNASGQCNIGGWTNIIRVAAGDYHTVGLKADGTVVAVGDNASGQCNIGGWTNIIRVAAGGDHTVGLKADGTVVAVGDNANGQCNVGGWTNIIRVAAGDYHTVGLKADGTVVAVGDNYNGQCNVGGWTDIIQVAAGDYHTVGLKTDGTVVAASLEAELAKWNLVLAVPPSQCVLTISSTAGGSVTTPGEGTFTYAPKTVVNLVAEAEDGYRFVKWTSDVITIADVKAAATIITIHGDYSITAKFVKRYDLSINSTEGGSVTELGEGVFTYDEGMVVDLVAEAEDGYRFVEWTGDVDTIARVSAAATIITINGDHAITANFEEIPPVNWLLIGGIIAAAVVAGLVIFFFRRRRAA